jgi:hypothetical protein
MGRLRGILFDYGHTLVWFPKYTQTHLTASKNVQLVLRDLGVSVGVSRARSLIESYVPRADGTSASVEEGAKGILVSAGVESFTRNDLRRVIEAEWKPYIMNVRVRKGVKEVPQKPRSNISLVRAIHEVSLVRPLHFGHSILKLLLQTFALLVVFSKFSQVGLFPF